jgi:hypothetical protein
MQADYQNGKTEMKNTSVDAITIALNLSCKKYMYNYDDTVNVILT